MSKYIFYCVLIAGLIGCTTPTTPSTKTTPAGAGGGGDGGGKSSVVAMETSMGIIKIELYPDKAPVTVGNFLDYVDAKFYDGTIFHRVAASPAVIQGGGMEPGGIEKPTRAPIKNEADNGLSNLRGSIAMARTSDPNSATAQFYINVKDNEFLDRARAQDGFGYCVFGKVIDGMDVVDKIKGVRTGRNDAPVEDVIIKSVRRVDK